MNVSSISSKFMALSKIYLSYRLKKTVCHYLPLYISIEPTNVCNLKCPMCINSLDRTRERGFMDFDLFKKIINEAKNFILNLELIGGGESLLHPKIIDMIQYAKDKKIKTVIIHTNATKLDAKMSEDLIKSGLDILSISFDGYDKETYEGMRVGAKFEETREKVKSFLQIKKNIRSKKPYTIIQSINMLDTVIDKEKTEKFRAYFNGLPVDEFYEIPMHNYGGKIKIGKTINNKKSKYTICTFPWYYLFILFDGTIVPCCVDWYGDYQLGNIRSTSLKEAWNSPKQIFLRKMLAEKRYKEIDICVNCDRLWRKSILGVPYRKLQLVRRFVLHYILS